MPFFTLPRYLVLTFGGRFLRDDDHGTHLGGKDIREVPEVVYGELVEQTGAFAGGIEVSAGAPGDGYGSRVNSSVPLE